MTIIILRRPKLGKATKYVVGFSNKIDAVVRNDKLLPENLEMVFRWGTTSHVNCNSIVNSAEAIHLVSDKSAFREVLMEHFRGGPLGAPAYEKPLCPFTWFDGGDLPDEHEYPVIVRPRHHSQGRHVYLCNNQAELSQASARCGPGWYASSYINKIAEYRVMMAQGRVIWVAKKTPGNPQDIAWNVARGGRFDNVRWDDWPLKAVRISREAFILSGLHFGAVDVMVDAEGSAYVLEINSAPSQTSPYRQECTAKVFDYIVEYGKNSIPVIEARGGYMKFIHPAICDGAIKG